ncbi:MAG: CsbD family protein [Vicinamibacterales bacterium]
MSDEKNSRDDSVSEETRAFGKRVKGGAKDAIGSITGNRSLESEGERENAEGRARQARNDVFDETDGVPGATVSDRAGASTRGLQQGSIREEAAGFGERMKGAAKDATGAVIGDERLEREGERENAQGRARQARNDAIGDSSRARASDSGWSNRNLVTGLYDSPASAGKAYQDLTTRHGYKDDDISVVMSEDTRKRHFGDVKAGQEFKEGSKAAEGAGIGGGIGLGVGAALGALAAAATSIAIPGLGLIVAGPIAGAIAGAGAGGATGTLLGALIGAGIPEDRAAEYERGIKEGGIVLGTRARDEKHATDLERDFTEYGARNILR